MLTVRIMGEDRRIGPKCHEKIRDDSVLFVSSFQGFRGFGAGRDEDGESGPLTYGNIYHHSDGMTE